MFHLSTSKSITDVVSRHYRVLGKVDVFFVTHFWLYATNICFPHVLCHSFWIAFKNMFSEVFLADSK